MAPSWPSSAERVCLSEVFEVSVVVVRLPSVSPIEKTWAFSRGAAVVRVGAAKLVGRGAFQVLHVRRGARAGERVLERRVAGHPGHAAGLGLEDAAADVRQPGGGHRAEARRDAAEHARGGDGADRVEGAVRCRGPRRA
jgi:hypothetical protein